MPLGSTHHTVINYIRYDHRSPTGWGWSLTHCCENGREIRNVKRPWNRRQKMSEFFKHDRGTNKDNSLAAKIPPISSQNRNETLQNPNLLISPAMIIAKHYTHTEHCGHFHSLCFSAQFLCALCCARLRCSPLQELLKTHFFPSSAYKRSLITA